MIEEMNVKKKVREEEKKSRKKRHKWKKGK